MTKIRLLCDWTDKLVQQWKNLIPKNTKIIFLSEIDDPDAIIDHYVVVNMTKYNVDPSKTFYFIWNHLILFVGFLIQTHSDSSYRLQQR